MSEGERLMDVGVNSDLITSDFVSKEVWFWSKGEGIFFQVSKVIKVEKGFFLKKRVYVIECDIELMGAIKFT